jgi:hypothetical protein
LFRRSALVKSGFVDATARGNFPFECDVFLRLAHVGATAWYQNEELLGFRFHRGSMRNYMKLMENRQVVEDMVRLFSKYEYVGAVERRRRRILSRLYRANALINLRAGERELGRSNLLAALKANVWSAKAWALAPLVILVPGLCSLVMPPPAETQQAPACAAAKKETA